jgi:hypothetical protein
MRTVRGGNETVVAALQRRATKLTAPYPFPNLNSYKCCVKLLQNVYTVLDWPPQQAPPGEATVLLGNTNEFRSNKVTLTAEGYIVWSFTSPLSLFDIAVFMQQQCSEDNFMYESVCSKDQEQFFSNPARLGVIQAFCALTEDSQYRLYQKYQAFANARLIIFAPNYDTMLDFLAQKDIDDPDFVEKYLTV